MKKIILRLFFALAPFLAQPIDGGEGEIIILMDLIGSDKPYAASGPTLVALAYALLSERCPILVDPVLFQTLTTRGKRFEGMKNGRLAEYHNGNLKQMIPSFDELKACYESLYSSIEQHAAYAKNIFSDGSLNSCDTYRLAIESIKPVECASQNFKQYFMLDFLCYQALPQADQWDVYAHPDAFMLFVPKSYIRKQEGRIKKSLKMLLASTKSSSKIIDAAFIDYCAKLCNLSHDSFVSGLALDTLIPIAAPFNPLYTNQYSNHIADVLKTFDTRKTPIGTLFPFLRRGAFKKIENDFGLTSGDSDFLLPEWDIILKGHGGGISNLEGDFFLIAGIRDRVFSQLLKFLDTAIRTRFLYYFSCWSSGEDIQKLFLNEQDRSRSLDLSYTIVTHAPTDITSVSTKNYVALRDMSVGGCVFYKRAPIQIPLNADLDPGLFFDAINKIFTQQALPASPPIEQITNYLNNYLEFLAGTGEEPDQALSGIADMVIVQKLHDALKRLWNDQYLEDERARTSMLRKNLDAISAILMNAQYPAEQPIRQQFSDVVHRFSGTSTGPRTRLTNIRMPHTEWFSLEHDIDPRIFIIDAGIVRRILSTIRPGIIKQLAASLDTTSGRLKLYFPLQPIKKTTPEALRVPKTAEYIALATPYIPLEVIVEATKPVTFISTIPGRAAHYIRSLNVPNGSFKDFQQSFTFYESARLTHSKIFLFEKAEFADTPIMTNLIVHLLRRQQPVILWIAHNKGWRGTLPAQDDHAETIRSKFSYFLDEIIPQAEESRKNIGNILILRAQLRQKYTEKEHEGAEALSQWLASLDTESQRHISIILDQKLKDSLSFFSSALEGLASAL